MIALRRRLAAATVAALAGGVGVHVVDGAVVEGLHGAVVVAVQLPLACTSLRTSVIVHQNIISYTIHLWEPTGGTDSQRPMLFDANGVVGIRSFSGHAKK